MLNACDTRRQAPHPVHGRRSPLALAAGAGSLRKPLGGTHEGRGIRNGATPTSSPLMETELRPRGRKGGPGPAPAPLQGSGLLHLPSSPPKRAPLPISHRQEHETGEAAKGPVTQAEGHGLPVAKTSYYQPRLMMRS